MRGNTQAEMNAGRLSVRKTMAIGLLDQIKSEQKWLVDFELDITGADPRGWKVIVLGQKKGRYEADWWTFPTEEDKATMMLLGVI